MNRYDVIAIAGLSVAGVGLVGVAATTGASLVLPLCMMCIGMAIGVLALDLSDKEVKKWKGK